MAIKYICDICGGEMMHEDDRLIDGCAIKDTEYHLYASLVNVKTNEVIAACASCVTSAFKSILKRGQIK